MTHSRRRLDLVLGSSAAFVTAVVLACSDTPPVAPDPVAARAAPTAAASSMSSCGASFTMVIVEDDSLLIPYGSATSSDTVNVCESWTGSDYVTQETLAGSNNRVNGALDSVAVVSYDGQGNESATDVVGNQSADPTAVGGRSFDIVQADSATIQASYDSPYYGVYAGDGSDGTGGCIQKPGAPACPLSVPLPGTQPYSRYNLSRAGVRALVNDAQEINPSREGYRRFQRVGTDGTVIRAVDPVTQLLMTDESVAAKGHSIARLTWRRTKNGYVHDRTDISSTDNIDGRQVGAYTTIQFSNVRINGVLVK